MWTRSWPPSAEDAEQGPCASSARSRPRAQHSDDASRAARGARLPSGLLEHPPESSPSRGRCLREGLAASPRLGLAAARLVGLHRLLEVAVLGAGKEAQRVQLREMLLRLGQVVEGQVRLADVLVGAPVLGIDGEGLLVDRD